MYAPILESINKLPRETISSARQETLQILATSISNAITKYGAAQINFICTHNSRRSHLAQIWAQVAAHYYDVSNIQLYSGGTEATAMYPMVQATLVTQGFKINELSTGVNPNYAIQYSDKAYPIIAFSKRYDHWYNPQSSFIAVMTCDHADVNCPIVTGADQKIAITYDDPKAFDDSPLQSEKYLERSIQIATEMCYVFNQISQSK